MKHQTPAHALAALAALVLAATAAPASAEDAYIESDGSQFINTGYYVKPESRIEVDFAFVGFEESSTYAQMRVLDNNAGNSTPSISASVYVSGGYSLAACIGDCGSFAGVWTSNSGEGTQGAYCDAMKRTIILDELNKRIALAVDGSEVWSNDQSSARTFNNTAAWPLGLFGRTKNAAGTTCDDQSSIRVYGFRIYESDELVHDYSPVVKGGVAGLLDAETGTFLYDTRHSGAGAFASGGDIETLDDDPYVESDGTSGINLGVMASPNLKIQVDYAMTVVEAGSGGDYQQRILGQDNSTSYPRISIYVNGSGNTSLASGDGWTAASTGIAADTNRHTAVIDNPALKWAYMTGVTTNWSYTASADLTKSALRPLGLFGNTYDDAGTSFNRQAKAKVYGCKIWAGDTLVRDLAPRCIDGTAGFEDLVTGRFYTCDGLTASANAPTALSGASSDGDAFIESDGSFYSIVNTYYFVGPNTKVEVDFSLATINNGQIVAGHYGNTFSALIYCPVSTSAANLLLESKDGGYATPTLSPAVPQDFARHTAVIDGPNKNFAFYAPDGTLEGKATVPDSWTYTKTSDRAFILFGTATDAYGHNNQRAKARIYGVKFYEGGTLALSLTPAVKGGVAGFVDGDGNFYSGDGLIAGGAVQTLDDDPYIASPDGGCFFDTGYTVTSNTCIKIDYMPLVQQTAQQFPFEAGTSGTTAMFMRGGYGNGSAGQGDIAYACGNSLWKSTGIPWAPLVRRTFTLDACNLKATVETAGQTLTNITIEAAGRLPDASASTLKIFSNASMNGNTLKGRLYGVKIYEEGDLVRDYVPICQGGTYALRDKVQGKVLSKASSSAAFTGSTGNNALNEAFFAEMRDEDAYIESDGTQGINLEYYTTPNTRYEIDYQMTGIVGQMRPFGEATSALSAELYIQGTATGSGNVAFGVGDSWVGQPSGVASDLNRHVAVLDIANHECGYSGKGMYAFTSATVCSKTATFPMFLFAKCTSAAGATSSYAKMKLYAFRIYESGALVHEYLPYKVGDTVGLYDTMTGAVKGNTVSGANAFTYGGGLGYGKFAGSRTDLVVAPSDTEVGVNSTRTLSAYAPGATGYVWTRNGVEIAGVTGADCTVAWEKPSQAGTLTYTVTPVFTKGGETVCGTAATAEVTMAPAAFVMTIR